MTVTTTGLSNKVCWVVRYLYPELPAWSKVVFNLDNTKIKFRSQDHQQVRLNAKYGIPCDTWAPIEDVIYNYYHGHKLYTVQV